MKPHLLFWSVCLLFCGAATSMTAQKPCYDYDCVLQKVSDLMSRPQRNYQLILDNLNSAEGYLNSLPEQEQIRDQEQKRRIIQEWRTKTFKEIEKERLNAQNARDEALKQTLLAKKALAELEIAKRKTEQTLELIYFYDNKFGLAYRNGSYGFIDKEQKVKIEFKYSEALAFNPQMGLAKVKSASDEVYFLIDTFGNEYKLATHWNQLDSTVIALDLSYQQLDTLPDVIFEQPQLQILLLPNNKITNLSNKIGLLTRLKYLDLGNNLLKELPAEVGKLTQLKALNLNNNLLTELPDELGQLTYLQFLNLNKHYFVKFPVVLNALAQLQFLEFDNRFAKSNAPAQVAWNHLHVKILEKRLRKEPNNMRWKSDLNTHYNNWVWYELMNGDFEAAELHAKQGIELRRDTLILRAHLAPALLLQGEYAEAAKLYLDLKDKAFKKDNFKFYRDVFKSDLEDLKAVIPFERVKDVAKIQQLLAQ